MKPQHATRAGGPPALALLHVPSVLPVSLLPGAGRLLGAFVTFDVAANALAFARLDGQEATHADELLLSRIPADRLICLPRPVILRAHHGRREAGRAGPAAIEPVVQGKDDAFTRGVWPREFKCPALGCAADGGRLHRALGLLS